MTTEEIELCRQVTAKIMNHIAQVHGPANSEEELRVRHTAAFVAGLYAVIASEERFTPTYEI